MVERSGDNDSDDSPFSEPFPEQTADGDADRAQREDSPSPEEIAELLKAGGDPGDETDDLAGTVAAADADADDDDEETEESSPAEAFGLKVGLVVAAIVVGALFVGPVRLFDVALDSGGLVPLETRESVTNEPFVLTAGATLVVGFFSGVAYPLTGRERETDLSDGPLGLPIPGGDDYRSEMAIGLVIPTMAVFVVLAVILALVPVAQSLFAGQIVQATIYFVVLALLAAIALGASVVLLALLVVASVYFIVPSFLGVFTGSFVGELIAG